MRHLIPYLVLVVFIIIILFSVKFGNKPINYEQKYDSLKQQLELERIHRVRLSNYVDSISLLLDSLEQQDSKIQVEIRYIPGKYNQLNSTELQEKMIEAYEQRE